jgi:hypothetical protein
MGARRDGEAARRRRRLTMDTTQHAPDDTPDETYAPDWAGPWQDYRHHLWHGCRSAPILPIRRNA